jgi:hypothetical protein
MRARLVAIAVLFGCGGDGGVSINANQDNVCDQVAEVACHNLYQCCAEGEIEHFLGVTDPRSESDCRTDVSRRCARSTASLEFGIAQKHLRFDSKTMNDCLDALLAPDSTCASIESALPWTDACVNSAWVGLVADAGACLSTLECASKDSFCGSNQTCIALPGDGQPCSPFGCASGAFCSAGTCRAQVAAGAACTSSLECLKGLFCDVSAAPAACAPLRDPGQACTGNASCASNKCNPGTCAGGTQTCFTDSACGRCATSNFTCMTDGDCASGTCSGTATFCSNITPCMTGTCVFPVKCNPGDCVGDVVCAEPHLTVDYCQGALNDLPIPEPPQQGF